MKNIIFIGAGGFASECYSILIENIKNDKTFCFKGFLSTSNDLEPYGLQHLYLGNYENYKFSKDDYILIAIGEPRVRESLYNNFKAKGVNFYTLIAKTAVIPNVENIGEGSIIANFVTIAMNTKIGVCNVLNTHSGIGHDSLIGDFNTFSTFTDICGFAMIGNNNFFTSRCSVLPHSKIGNNNKFLPATVVYKKCKNDSIMQGNPALKICNREDLN